MKINGYTIIDELSQGPISTVFLGRQDALNRQVFIKRLNTQWLGENDLRERFRREALICARLNHPNIVQVIDVGTEPDNLYIISEYVNGVNLGAFLKAQPDLPIAMVLWLSREIIQGLAYAHEHGILHRDIKPENIMLSRDGGVKISDFGLARAEDLPSLTFQGEVVGTPAYMSPEQARLGTVDQRSDLFSLGITLYEVCGGPSPFKGENLVSSIEKLMKGNPRPISEINPDLPDWFAEMVMQLLAKSADKRPESAQALLELPGFLRLPTQLPQLREMLKTSFPDLAHPIISPGQVTPAALPTPAAAPKAFPLLPLGALLLVIFLAGGFWYGFGTGEPQKASTQTPALRPPDSLADTTANLAQQTGQPAENPSQPSIRQEEPAPRTAKPQTVKPETLVAASVNTPEPARQDSLPATGPEQRPEVGPGRLWLICSPWAKVFADGKYLDTTPLTRPIEFAPGTVDLMLSHPDFPPLHRNVEIRSGKTDTLSFALREFFGFVDLTVRPWATVFLNGEKKGTTPLEHPIALTPGRYLLRLEHPQMEAWSDSIDVLAGQVYQNNITLQSGGR
ncbi:MAG TPA: protein kinase [Calditrichia bacterium]|nr:protein kinase [Calditrichia bacterium]